ncbi:MAG TPA: tetratricopeptide repeat protein [Dehalococcoidia bacterium]|nr:tetratricopeptide repeat protein [Dehalococcoidia bacterium]
MAAGLGLALIRPVQADDYIERGDALAGRYAFTEAIGEYLKARSQTPHDPAIALRLARVHRARGEYDQAALELESALAAPVTRPAALLEAGDLAQLRGDGAQAKAQWEAAAAAAPANPAPISRLAGQAVRERDLKGAQARLEQLVRLTPADSPTRFQLALVAALSDRDQARQHLSTLDAGAPEFVRQRANAFATALDQADRAADSAEADLVLGQAYLDANEIGLAETALDRALRANPALDAARSRLAYALTQTGDATRARELAEATVASTPDDPMAWEALGLAQRSAGDLAGAKETFEAAQQRFPSDPLFAAELGNTLVGLGDGLGAEPWYNRAVELAPTEPAFLVLKAKFYLDRAWQVDRGLQAAWRAEELRPADAEIKDLVGWGHYLKHDRQTAVDKLTEAIRIEPTLAIAHYHLAIVLESAGELALARVEYQSARDLARDKTLREAAELGAAKLPAP